MLLLLLACARAPLPPAATPAPLAAPPAPPALEAPTAPPERAEDEAAALSVEILDLGLSMHGGDGDNLPLTVTWVASAQVTVGQEPLRIEEVRWVVESEGVRFVARSAGGDAPLAAGGPPARLEAARPLRIEDFKALREQTAEVTLLVIAEDEAGEAQRAEDSRNLVHPLR